MEKKRILFVDDSIEFTMISRLWLESSGLFTVQIENSAECALSTARNFAPHLIFLDCDLEGKCGFKVAAELRADSELGSVPIAFMTGGVTKEEAAQRIFEGVPTLAKPFDANALRQAAVRLLGGAQPKRSSVRVTAQHGR